MKWDRNSFRSVFESVYCVCSALFKFIFIVTFIGFWVALLKLLPEMRVYEKLLAPDPQPSYQKSLEQKPLPAPQVPQSVKPAEERAESDSDHLRPPSDVTFIDFDRLMKDSRPGTILSRYVTDYRKRIDEAVAKIDAAADKARKGKKSALYETLLADRRDLLTHRANVSSSADKYLRSIVKSVLARSRDLKDVVIFDAGEAFYIPPSQDITNEVIVFLKDVSPAMPELPKITVRGDTPAARKKTEKPAPQSGAGKGAKGKSSPEKSAPTRRR